MIDYICSTPATGAATTPHPAAQTGPRHANRTMSFACALNNLHPALPYYLALTKHGLMRLSQHGFKFDPTSPGAPPMAVLMARATFSLGRSNCTEAYVMSRTLAEGPKLFAFDAVTCEALENFDLNLSTKDYHQPFPSVVIELPADYIEKRVVPFEGGTHAPGFVIVRHEPEAGCILMAMHMTSHQVMTRRHWLDPALSLEEMWVQGATNWGASDSLVMTPEETALGNALSKLAMNVCLMATAYGVRSLGPANPSHYGRLKRYAKLARKRGREQQEKADMEVQIMPVRYSFAQEVTLYRREPATGHRDDEGNGGWQVSPHWRRGHWRDSPCGPGRKERRRVAIPAVMVNGHLFLGSPSDTTATYRARPSNGEVAAPATS